MLSAELWSSADHKNWSEENKGQKFMIQNSFHDANGIQRMILVWRKKWKMPEKRENIGYSSYRWKMSLKLI